MSNSASKPEVTKMYDGGYDVQFPEGGRVILSADDASSKEQAVKVAKERLEQSGRVVDDTAETPVGKTTAHKTAADTDDADDADDDADATAKAQAAEKEAAARAQAEADAAADAKAKAEAEDK